MSTSRGKKLLRNERGETMVSYALLVVLLSVICIPSALRISYGVGATACRIELEGPVVMSEHGENWDGKHCWSHLTGRGPENLLW